MMSRTWDICARFFFFLVFKKSDVTSSKFMKQLSTTYWKKKKEKQKPQYGIRTLHIWVTNSAGYVKTNDSLYQEGFWKGTTNKILNALLLFSA